MCSASRRLKTVRLCSVVWLRNRDFSLQSFTIRRCLTSRIITTQLLLFGSWLFLSHDAPKEGGGGRVLWVRAIEAYGFVFSARQNFLFTNFAHVFSKRVPLQDPPLPLPGSAPHRWVRKMWARGFPPLCLGPLFIATFLVVQASLIVIMSSLYRGGKVFGKKNVRRLQRQNLWFFVFRKGVFCADYEQI